MTLTFSATVAERGFDVGLRVETGETVAILGPNGAGKSTLLEIIAGLLRPDAGRADLDDAVLFDLTDGRGHWAAPHARGVSTLTQDADLFPHLSVLENVAFSARSKGIRKAAAHEIAEHWLSEVDALQFAGRRPAELSGGQAQRVAIARALASDPKLLLLDEPLAALDVAVAPAIRRTLLRVLRDRTAIIVTHDILDALTLADRVVVLGHGHIIEQGATRETLDRPRTTFTAGLAALNLLTGTRTSAGMTTDSGMQIISTVSSEAPLGISRGRHDPPDLGSRLIRSVDPLASESGHGDDPRPGTARGHHPREVRRDLGRPHSDRGRRRADHHGDERRVLLRTGCGHDLPGRRSVLSDGNVVDAAELIWEPIAP